jgi:small subunit ribosomal protein S8
MKLAIVSILLREGFIDTYEIVPSAVSKIIRVWFKFGANGKCVINGAKRISKSGLRVYRGFNNLPKILGGLGIAILSTSKGVITDKVARDLKVGGEVLITVW